MLDLQRNLSLEAPCGPLVVIHVIVRVFQPLDLELGSLAGLEGFAEKHILHILLGLAVRLDKVMLTAFLLEWGLIQYRCVSWVCWGWVVEGKEAEEPLL